jgi:hypothetical protein
MQTAGNALNGVVNSINAGVASLNQHVAGMGGASMTRSANNPHLRDTQLKDILANSNKPGWPRVAVNINRLPSWFYVMPPSGQQGVYSAQDCINISVTAWESPTKSRSFDHIDFCGDDIVRNVSFSHVMVWKNMALNMNGANTGARRTMGPTAPQNLFPNNPGTQMFTMLNGPYFLGSIMATVGYNWDDMQDTRFWVVNVPSMQDSQSGTERPVKMPG